MRRTLATLLLVIAGSAGVDTLAGINLPNRAGTVRFAVLGDSGSGDQGQNDIAAQMAAVHRLFRFDFVIMLGDNFYGPQAPADLIRKFDRPYRPLLDAGVRFHAAIGNHDDPNTINYPALNMGGRRYYTHTRPNVRFFVLDTNVMDAEQLRWFEAALQQAPEPWKIAYFHHPIHGNAGRHGAAVDIRILLEPLLLKYGVSVVFSGHDHVYERLNPQKGVHYFVAGSGGKLRRGDLTPDDDTALGFDQEQAFMIAEIDGSELFFQTISRSGRTVDTGTIPCRPVRIGTM